MGVRRTGAEQNRKYPVTVEMLAWLQERPSAGKLGDAARWAAISAAFFFMPRASEYLADPPKPWVADRALLGRDATPRRDGRARSPFSAADEVVVYTKGSKTIQCNFGMLP